jgi:hypothetical protein
MSVGHGINHAHAENYIKKTLPEWQMGRITAEKTSSSIVSETAPADFKHFGRRIYSPERTGAIYDLLSHDSRAAADIEHPATSVLAQL